MDCRSVCYCEIRCGKKATWGDFASVSLDKRSSDPQMRKRYHRFCRVRIDVESVILCDMEDATVHSGLYWRKEQRPKRNNLLCREDIPSNLWDEDLLDKIVHCELDVKAQPAPPFPTLWEPSQVFGQLLCRAVGSECPPLYLASRSLYEQTRGYLKSAPAKTPSRPYILAFPLDLDQVSERNCAPQQKSPLFRINVESGQVVVQSGPYLRTSMEHVHEDISRESHLRMQSLTRMYTLVSPRNPPPEGVQNLPETV